MHLDWLVSLDDSTNIPGAWDCRLNVQQAHLCSAWPRDGTHLEPETTIRNYNQYHLPIDDLQSDFQPVLDIVADLSYPLDPYHWYPIRRLPKHLKSLNISKNPHWNLLRLCFYPARTPRKIQQICWAAIHESLWRLIGDMNSFEPGADQNVPVEKLMMHFDANGHLIMT